MRLQTFALLKRQKRNGKKPKQKKRKKVAPNLTHLLLLFVPRSPDEVETECEKKKFPREKQSFLFAFSELFSVASLRPK